MLRIHISSSSKKWLGHPSVSMSLNPSQGTCQTRQWIMQSPTDSSQKNIITEYHKKSQNQFCSIFKNLSKIFKMSSSPNTHSLCSMELVQFELNKTVSRTPPAGVWTSPSVSDLTQTGPKLKVILGWNQLWLTKPLHMLLGVANCSWGKKWRTKSLHFSLKPTLKNLTWWSNNDEC